MKLTRLAGLMRQLVERLTSLILQSFIKLIWQAFIKHLSSTDQYWLSINFSLMCTWWMLDERCRCNLYTWTSLTSAQRVLVEPARCSFIVWTGITLLARRHGRLPDYVTDVYGTARSCGGSHTLTSSHKRLAKLHQSRSDAIYILHVTVYSASCS